jgi:predicted RNase H-like nuclease
MYFLGLDLAWGAVNRTGVAVIDNEGQLQVLATEITDDNTVAAIGPYIAGDCLVAIDAPLLVTNESHRRPAEAELDQQFRSFQAGPYPAFKAHPSGMFDPPRGALLAQKLNLDIDPQSTGPRRAIEVYPHPATVALFRLGCTLKYKNGRGATCCRADGRPQE